MIRIVTGLLGAIALCWAVLAAQSSRASAPYEDLARQITAGAAFADDVLLGAAGDRIALTPPRIVNATRQRAAAILRLRLLESALDRGDPAALDARMAALRSALHDAFAANPADPFLWLTQYWLDTTQLGSASDNLAFLAASYAFGPREGWIALRRDRLGLTMFARLDAPTQQLVVSEFSAMVDARFTVEAADNLAGPGWPIRDRLVASVAEADPGAKQALARYLYSQGIALAIPGVLDVGERPWR